jgi:hypothetical protein
MLPRQSIHIDRIGVFTSKALSIPLIISEAILYTDYDPERS